MKNNIKEQNDGNPQEELIALTTNLISNSADKLLY